ncbi:hypothetical protein DdX_00492 [Ditylenchus destructor]|uniref:Uncharacterized protein n=1 Tax=Ditylenchus destructor TaxID=166010 RepID=A0AAD4NF15_9BILA|nr:hypothetical protein DdX_00492 [Ditylenchus destructor]
MQHIQRLNDTGGSLTLDFCKNGVDYLAVTAHYISNSWKKINFIILFSPVPGSMKKTTRNIQELILDDLSQYGITSNIWLNIKENIAQQNPYINSLSQAMQHAFVKKIGDLSDPDWLKSTHFNVNVSVTAAFLDPIVHSQLAYLCDKIPAFDYEKMKQIIHKAARPFVGQSPRITSTKRTMFPQLQTIEWIYKPIDDELSMYTTMRKYNFTRNRMHPEFNATLVQLRNSYLQETL